MSVKIDHKRIFNNSLRLYFAPLVGAIKEVRAEMRRMERQRNADVPVVNPSPRYTIAALLAASDYSQPQPAKERELVDAPAAGGEL